MNTRNTLSFAHFAAVCSSMLLAGALSAQAADAKPQPQREPADVAAAQASDAYAQKKAYHKKRQDKLDQVDRDAARGSDQTELDPMDQLERDDRDYLERDRKVGKSQDSDQLEQDGATLEPVPQDKPLPQLAEMALDIEAVDGGLTISLQRDSNELWVGAILGSLDSRTRQVGELPPLLGDSTVLAAGIISQDMLGRQITADVRHGGFDWIGFYVQGVAFTLEGVQATEVAKATFGRGAER